MRLLSEPLQPPWWAVQDRSARPGDGLLAKRDEAIVPSSGASRGISHTEQSFAEQSYRVVKRLEPPTVGRRDPHLPIADGALRGSQSRASLLRGTIPPDRSRGGLARWPTIRAALAAPFTTRGDSRPPSSPLRSQVHSPHIHQGGEVPSTTTTRDLATLVGGAGLEPADLVGRRDPREFWIRGAPKGI